MGNGAVWTCKGRVLDVFERVHVMGILNVTPDSFSDGGLFLETEGALSQANKMIAEGAEIIDVGGESTRPGAEPVDTEEELRRVIPVIQGLAELDVTISIDTTKSKVAEAAIEAGAHIVNDVSAMRSDPLMSKVVAATGAGVVLMHMLGEPRTMQKDPIYRNVVTEVSDFLMRAAGDAEMQGIPSGSIAIDPGIGFGKTLDHNLELIRSVGSFVTGRYPLLVGPSRKSFIGLALDLPVDQRLEATAGAVAWLVQHGANVVRVHDVAAMVRVVRMIEAIRGDGA